MLIVATQNKMAGQRFIVDTQMAGHRLIVATQTKMAGLRFIVDIQTKMADKGSLWTHKLKWLDKAQTKMADKGLLWTIKLEWLDKGLLWTHKLTVSAKSVLLLLRLCLTFHQQLRSYGDGATA